MSVAGRWALTIATPIGRQHAVLEVVEERGGLHGSASSGGQSVPIFDAAFDGTTLRWTQHVEKPLKLTLKFEVQIDGDQMTGVAKAGILPASKLHGTRQRSP